MAPGMAEGRCSRDLWSTAERQSALLSAGKAQGSAVSGQPREHRREILAWRGSFGGVFCFEGDILLGTADLFPPTAATQMPFFTLQDVFSSAHSMHRIGMLDWQLWATYNGQFHNFKGTEGTAESRGNKGLKPKKLLLHLKKGLCIYSYLCSRQENLALQAKNSPPADQADSELTSGHPMGCSSLVLPKPH